MKDTGNGPIIKKFDDRFTWYGAYRYRIQKVKTGWFSSKQVLVLQYQLHYTHWSHVAGNVDYEDCVDWLDAKAEWLLQDAAS